MSFKFESTGMVEYSTASKLARAYSEQIVHIREALAMLASSVHALQDTFKPQESYAFNVRIAGGCYGSADYSVTDERIAGMIELHLHRTAWRVLINKLGIRKLMSSKRAQQLDTLLEKGEVINEAGERETLPEINEQTIIGVIMSLVDSASTFLDEAIHEEYDYWKPSPNWTKHKTNTKHDFKLERKLIKDFAFSTWKHGGKSEVYGLNHNVANHMTALDNIMHMLDGKGQVSGYCGPLVDAINGARRDSLRVVTTDYFRAKWFSNGNLHLEFTRQDLLDKFNEICGRNRLAEVA